MPVEPFPARASAGPGTGTTIGAGCRRGCRRDLGGDAVLGRVLRGLVRLAPAWSSSSAAASTAARAAASRTVLCRFSAAMPPVRKRSPTTAARVRIATLSSL